jgi:uncharacterized glyoxalase superfamily protein PhnB
MLSHIVLYVTDPPAVANWLMAVLGATPHKQACEGQYIELASAPEQPTASVIALTTPSVMASFTGHTPPLYGGGVLLSWRVASQTQLATCLEQACTHGAILLQAPKRMPWGHTVALVCLPTSLVASSLLIELNCPVP